MKQQIVALITLLSLVSCATTDKIFHGAIEANSVATEASFPFNVVLYPVAAVSAFGIAAPIAFASLAIEAD